MKRSELLAELRGLKSDLTNTRGWLNAIDERVDKLITALSAPAEQPYKPAQELARSYDADGGGTPAAEMRASEMPTDKPSVRRVEFDGDPVAPSVESLVTPKQLGMIRALAREAGVDYEIECRNELGCDPGDLGRRAASAFIDYLKALQEQGAAFQEVS